MRTHPVPGGRQTAVWGQRGRHWSCNRDANGNGRHTGTDWAHSSGSPIVAPVAGVIRHVSAGSAFGPHQFLLVPDADPRGGFQFGHTLDRLPNGTRVAEGQQIARVGALGNATGPHLHLEWWLNAGAGWGCSNNADPVAAIRRLQGTSTPPTNPPPAAGGWLIEGVLMSTATTIVYFSHGGGIFEARLLEGTYAHVPNPDVLRERRQSLDTSGIRWRDAGATNRERWGREVAWA